MIKVAIGHEKKNYNCEINPSCSFSGKKLVIKSSLNKTKRYHFRFIILNLKKNWNLIHSYLIIYRNKEKDVSINPHYLNYGDSQPEDSIWNKSGIKISVCSSICTRKFLHNNNYFFRKYNCLCCLSNYIGFDRNHLGSWLWSFNNTKIWPVKK